MTVVNLTALETQLQLAGPIDRGEVVATYWAGAAAFVNVAGAQVIFPAPIRVTIVAGAPTETLDLVPTAGACCVRWEVRSDGAGRNPPPRYTSIPGSGPVNFGDLPIVDPESFLPTPVTPTLVETILQVTEDSIGSAVEEYLTDNPPSSGFAHTQSSPSASWVIPHPFGRIPNVAVYVLGELIETDITATTSTVTITFPSPTAGIAVLN